MNNTIQGSFWLILADPARAQTNSLSCSCTCATSGSRTAWLPRACTTMPTARPSRAPLPVRIRRWTMVATPQWRAPLQAPGGAVQPVRRVLAVPPAARASRQALLLSSWRACVARIAQAIWGRSWRLKPPRQTQPRPCKTVSATPPSKRKSGSCRSFWACLRRNSKAPTVAGLRCVSRQRILLTLQTPADRAPMAAEYSRYKVTGFATVSCLWCQLARLHFAHILAYGHSLEHSH